MPAPAPRTASDAAIALALAFGLGTAEAGLSFSPAEGFNLPERLGLWLAAVGSQGLCAALALLALPLLRRRWPDLPAAALILAALAALHLTMAWRSGPMVNVPLRSPALLGGMALAVLLSMGLIPLFAGPLRPGLLPLASAAGLLGMFRLALPTPIPAALPPGPPDLLLITLDTTRPDRLSAYGGPAATPHIEALARAGLRFDQAIASAPLTQPSHLAILSGQAPLHSGVVSNGTALGDRPALLPRRLNEGDRRYHSAAFVSGFPLHSRFGWSQGFDRYDDDFGELRGLHRLSALRLLDQLRDPGRGLRERRAQGAVDRALRWLEETPGPRLLWLHLFDPHAPYEAPGHPLPGPDHAEQIAAYDAELAYVDAQLGRLLEALPEREGWVVALTADHGESLTEHGYYFDHGDNLYDPSLRVPLILRGPGLPAGRTSPCQVSNADLYATLLGLAGLPAETPDSRDLRALLPDGPCPERPLLASAPGARHVQDPPLDWALRRPERKLILHGGDAGVQCYDLLTDPGETQDLGRCPEEEALLSDRLQDQQRALPVAQDEATRRALEALGYLEPSPR